MAKSNLFLRVITAIILIPVALIIIFFGNEKLIFLLLSAIMLACSYELYRMLDIKGKAEVLFGFFLNQILLTVLIYFKTYCIFAIVSLFFVTLCYSLFIKGIDRFILLSSKYLLSLFYLPFLLSFTYMVFLLEDGRFWLLYLLATNWATDSFAYFVGGRFGKHQLSKISPKKSIEGLAGGILGGILISVIFYLTYFKRGEIYLFIALGILGSVIGQVSDLIESGIKRASNVKDSGNVIPGHGGLLDRFDSLFFTGPLFYFYIVYLLGVK